MRKTLDGACMQALFGLWSSQQPPRNVSNSSVCIMPTGRFCRDVASDTSFLDSGRSQDTYVSLRHGTIKDWSSKGENA